MNLLKWKTFQLYFVGYALKKVVLNKCIYTDFFLFSPNGITHDYIQNVQGVSKIRNRSSYQKICQNFGTAKHRFNEFGRDYIDKKILKLSVLEKATSFLFINGPIRFGKEKFSFTVWFSMISDWKWNQPF